MPGEGVRGQLRAGPGHPGHTLSADTVASAHGNHETMGVPGGQCWTRMNFQKVGWRVGEKALRGPAGGLSRAPGKHGQVRSKEGDAGAGGGLLGGSEGSAPQRLDLCRILKSS